MATAHPKRDIGPRTPFLELPGDLMWPTVRRLGELGLDASTLDRRAPGRREDDQSAPVQLEQQRAGGHVF